MITPGQPVQQPTAPAIARVTDFGSGIVLAAYLFIVIYQGNMRVLADDALQDYGYLEWLLAIVILYQIYRLVDNKIVAWLIISGVVAVLLKLTAGNQTLVKNIQAFGQGKTDLFSALTSLGAKGSGVGIQTVGTGTSSQSSSPTGPEMAPQPTPLPIRVVAPPTQTNTVAYIPGSGQAPSTGSGQAPSTGSGQASISPLSAILGVG
jgi:hypothetical protein